VSYKNRFEEAAEEENLKEKQSSNELKLPENTMGKRAVSPNKLSDSEEISENLSAKSASSNRSAVSLKADFDQINLYSLLGRQKICLIFKLWEAMMLSECLLIMADNPALCR
jgi:hypothetical protein